MLATVDDLARSNIPDVTWSRRCTPYRRFGYENSDDDDDDCCCCCCRINDMIPSWPEMGSSWCGICGGLQIANRLSFSYIIGMLMSSLLAAAAVVMIDERHRDEDDDVWVVKNGDGFMEKQSHCCGSNVVMKKIMLRRRAVMVFMQRAVVSNDGSDGIFHLLWYQQIWEEVVMVAATLMRGVSPWF